MHARTKTVVWPPPLPFPFLVPRFMLFIFLMKKSRLQNDIENDNRSVIVGEQLLRDWFSYPYQLLNGKEI